VNDEKLLVRVTSSGQTLEVVVVNKRLDVIQVVLGEGVHSVRCDLTPRVRQGWRAGVANHSSARRSRGGVEFANRDRRRSRRGPPLLPGACPVAWRLPRPSCAPGR
jgi:hypothetical protein